MAINPDKVSAWKVDVAKSVDQYNSWFMGFAPETFRANRKIASSQVESVFKKTDYLRDLSPATLGRFPEILPILRMCMCPPVARDRLVGLSGVSKNLVTCMEERKTVPLRMLRDELEKGLKVLSDTMLRMVDSDIFVWL